LTEIQLINENTSESNGDSQRNAEEIFIYFTLLPGREKLNLNTKRFDQLFEGS